MVDRGDDDRTSSAAGAEWIELIEDVKLAAEVAVVDGETAAKTHPTEMCRLHHDHLVVGRTAGNELLGLTVLRHNA